MTMAATSVSSSVNDPVVVEAAGGLVVRPGDSEIEVLMILRRGVWDLPKGKLDPGETPAGCAIREVEEETGAEDLDIVQGAGMTLHRYSEAGLPIIKTTWWFFMTTTSEIFIPEEREQIAEVRWMTWSSAAAAAGYPNLKRHLEDLAHTVKSLGQVLEGN